MTLDELITKLTELMDPKYEIDMIDAEGRPLTDVRLTSDNGLCELIFEGDE